MAMEFGSQLANLWKAGIVSVIWVIWTARNEYRFNNKRTTLRSAFATVWRFIREASLSKSGCMQNTVDDLQVLRRLRISGIPRRAPNIIEVNWKVPPSGWIKVNTDGATFGAPGLSGCAGVFRTSRSFVKGCFCIPLGISYAYEAELAAAIYAVKYAYTFQWRRLWLESDSLYVVSLFQTRSSSVPWRWHSAWTDCLDKITHMEFYCSHIYREGNAAADSLASRAPSLCTATWWWNVPHFASSFIYSDANNKPNYRFC